MKRLQFTEMTDEVYDVMTALRGPDCEVLAHALKWVITGRIRFYVLPQIHTFPLVTRCDACADASWAQVHRDWDKAVEVGVPWFSLDHWIGHAELALRTIHDLCLTDTCDVARQDEIHIMFDLLNAARTALDPHADTDKVVTQAAQFVHTQLSRLQAITDGLAQSQEATSE